MKLGCRNGNKIFRWVCWWCFGLRRQRNFRRGRAISGEPKVKRGEEEWVWMNGLEWGTISPSESNSWATKLRHISFYSRSHPSFNLHPLNSEQTTITWHGPQDSRPNAFYTLYTSLFLVTPLAEMIYFYIYVNNFFSIFDAFKSFLMEIM